MRSDAGPGAVASLWRATARHAPPPLDPLRDEAVADLAVVGGGFGGLSVALHAAERGLSVVLLEAEEIGHGASGRNGGQVNPGVKADEAALVARFGEEGRAFHRLGQDAPDILADLIARHGLDCGFARPGLIRLAHNETALATLRQAADALRREGVAAEDLAAADVERRVGTTRYPGGLYDPRGASVHPLDLAREMARVAQGAGARLFVRSPVERLTREGGGWRVATADGALRARQVAVLTNAYTDRLVPGLQASLLPVNSFQIATAPLGAAADGILPGGETVYDSRRLVLYFRRSPDGRLMLGGRASFRSRESGGAVPDYTVLEGVLRDLFPAIDGVPVTFRWTGLVAITLDHLPHYHVPDGGLHVLAGFNGRGVAMAHAAGAWLAGRIAGDPAPGLPATPIRPIPLQRLRTPLLHLAMRWNHLLDLVGR